MSEGNYPAIAGFRKMLEGNMRGEIAKQLPKGVDVDRFIRTAINAVQMNPDLLKADRTSLFGSIMAAAADGLLADGREATIQIYRTKVRGPNGGDIWIERAQYMPMVGGIIKTMYEAGCTYVDAAAVYEKDHFRFRRGDDPGIEHEPYLGDEDPGNVVAVYAIVKLANGEVKREVMPRRDIEKVRGTSKAANGPGWTTWYDQFGIKSVLKRIYKQLPHTSMELETLFQHDNEAMGFETFQKQEPQDLTALAGEGQKAKAIAHEPGKSSRLKSIIAASGVSNGHEPEPVPEEQVPVNEQQPSIQF